MCSRRTRWPSSIRCCTDFVSDGTIVFMIFVAYRQCTHVQKQYVVPYRANNGLYSDGTVEFTVPRPGNRTVERTDLSVVMLIVRACTFRNHPLRWLTFARNVGFVFQIFFTRTGDVPPKVAWKSHFFNHIVSTHIFYLSLLWRNCRQ